jgi:hypothetical protein
MGGKCLLLCKEATFCSISSKLGVEFEFVGSWNEAWTLMYQSWGKVSAGALKSV